MPQIEPENGCEEPARGAILSFRPLLPPNVTRLLPLLAILAFAVVVRLYALGGIPSGVWYDEAFNGLDGIASALGGRFPVFYPDNHGREGLFINLIGWSERLFGVTPFALRLPAALAGIATVAFIYLMGKSLYSRRIGLFAAWFGAAGFWPVLMSRIAFRAVLSPVSLTAAIYFAVEARRRASLTRATAAGICCGLGLHSYPTFRVAVLVLVFVMIAEFRDRTDGAAPRWTVLAATALLVALPILVYFARVPAAAVSRSDALVIHSPHPVLYVLYNIGETVRMFVLNGDTNWRHNLSGSPEFAWPMALFFLGGVAVTLWRLRRQSHRWQWLPWAWMVIGLIPCAVTDEAPHAIRAGVVMPAALLFCAIGADAAMAALVRRPIAARALVALAVMAGIAETTRYFTEYAPLVAATGAFARRDAEIARAMNSLPFQTKRYVVVSGNNAAIRFGTYGHPQPELIPADQLCGSDNWHTRLEPGSVIASLLPDAQPFAELRECGVQFHVAAEYHDFLLAVVAAQSHRAGKERARMPLKTSDSNR